jgi:hypothetical protein
MARSRALSGGAEGVGSRLHRLDWSRLVTRRLVAVVLLATAVVGLFVGMGIGLFELKPDTTSQAGATLEPLTPDPETPTATPTPTSTERVGPPLGRTYVVTNAVNKLAADVAGGGKDDGTPVILFPPHGRANQQWTVQEAGSGLVTLVSVDSGKCLQMENGSREAGVVAELDGCSGDEDSQRWRFAENQDGWSLTSERSGLVLDASDDEVDGNRRVIQKDPEPGARSQVWFFTPVN